MTLLSLHDTQVDVSLSSERLWETGRDLSETLFGIKIAILLMSKEKILVTGGLVITA